MGYTFEELYQLYDYCMRMGYAYLHCHEILETEENKTKANQYLWLARVYEEALAG